MLQVFYYADRIFLSAGVETNNVQYVTVSIGAINVVMTCLAVSAGALWVLTCPLSQCVTQVVTYTARCFVQYVFCMVPC